MAKLNLVTYKDAIGHCLDYMGAATDPQTERFARSAVQKALNEVQNKRNWVYFYQRGRITTNASYNTGTIEYDHHGGANERMVTLTGGTWPVSAQYGVLTLGLIPYEVASRVSDTVITLTRHSNPGADVTAGTNYRWFREVYTLPVDYSAGDEFVIMGQARVMMYVTPGEFVAMQRTSISPATPYVYTITSDPHYFGALGLRLYPAPDQAYVIDFSYRRSPRALVIDAYEEGMASIVNGSTVLTGSGTSWHARMPGSIIRFSRDAQDVPTGPSGAKPFWLERSIASFTDASTMALDADPGESLSGVKYSISDPVDIEAGAMLTYFLRECERQSRMIRRMKATTDEEQQYRESMVGAMEADARHYESRYTFSNSASPVRMARMPLGPDIP